MSHNTTKVFDFNVYAEPVENITLSEKKKVINTLNAYSYVITKRDIQFKNALQESDILLPDGFPIVKAARLLNKKKIHKIAGADIFNHLTKVLNQTSGSCFFMGSSNNTLDKIKSKLNREFPNVKAGFYSPPYKPTFTKEENDAIFSAINEFNPDVIFVGMTAPKQEKWVAEHQQFLNTKAIVSIGAVFDFYAGTVSRPSEFWINNNLEWFIRMIKEPKRLWKRYLVYSPIFFIDLLFCHLKGSSKD